MEIRETLMTRAFSVMHNDPYLLSLRAMEEISKSAKVIERANVYETDGPHHRSRVHFDTVELVDDFSRIIFSFEMNGEDGLLRVKVNGALELEIIETGVFSEAFVDHYARSIFPLLRKVSEDRIEMFSDAMDSVFGRTVKAEY